MGKGATGDEREVAKNVAEGSHTANDTNVVFEGQEKEQFWNILGGKGPYHDERVFGKSENSEFFIPRLFQGSNASGSFRGSINANAKLEELSCRNDTLVSLSNISYLCCVNVSIFSRGDIGFFSGRPRH